MSKDDAVNADDEDSDVGERGEIAVGVGGVNTEVRGEQGGVDDGPAGQQIWR